MRKISEPIVSAFGVISFLLLTLALGKGCGSGPAQTTAPSLPVDVSAFDHQRAFSLLEQQVRFGPRVPGSPSSRQTQDLIASHLSEAGFRVLRQNFSVRYRGVNYSMVNVIGLKRGTGRGLILLAAHYDSRPVADQDLNPANRNQPIPGANDGASGVAILLEIARTLKDASLRPSVVLIFFDGEDLGDTADGGMLFGSRHFARNLVVEGVNLKADKGLLLDLVGDADFRSNDEWYSRQYAPQVVDSFLQAARRLGFQDRFYQPPTLPIIDDHLPLNEVGIPTANVIDFDYPYWHTLADTPDKCSPQTLRIVGQTTLLWLLNQ
ncbi:MAG: M28 family peptidase [Armatimonadetes bacterium]|nr:M28 family peptidase [Armatimonadota bacterium]MDW8122177.1 M28 family peptidase [Armatimonadota bacterium]